MAAPDAFILFNEREEKVEKIVGQLQSLGVGTYFWRRDIPFGSEWAEKEQQELRDARAVVIFLGHLGWGPNHLLLAEQAQVLEKRIIPVKIGDPPPAALDKAEGLFRNRRYFDLHKIDKRSLQSLADAILDRATNAESTRDFDQIVSTLVDGNEEERAEVLRQIQTSALIDKPALAARLREEITKRFSAENEKKLFASAVRDPKKMSSIRSWMLSSIIWADAEGLLNREILLAHVQERFEPDRSVRYWTLAGLYQVKATYLGDATKLCLSDKAPEVSALARAIAFPDAPALIVEFRNQLLSSEFENAWPVLRVLRIVPIPELAADVCQQFIQSPPSMPLAYDCLYALSQAGMAPIAAKLLEERTSVLEVATRVIAVARGSNANAIRNFVVLLAACPEASVEAALKVAEEREDERNIAQLFRRFLREYRKRDADNELFIPGFDSDAIDVSKDPLDIREDVQTLTAVMLATEVKPPLAIGLFGDWGSGKSFFMKSMLATATRLAAKTQDASNPKFCSHIVQIEFNAWHYVDTNLWASLVSHILDTLAAYVSPTLSPEQQQAALIKELDSAKTAIPEVEAEKKQARELIAEREQELQRLQKERQEKEVRLSDLRPSDLQSLLSTEQKNQLENSLDEIGIPKAINSVSNLSRVLTDAYTVRGRALAVFFALINSKSRAVVLVLVALVLCGGPLAYFALGAFDASRFIKWLTTLTTEGIAFVAAGTAFLRKALEKVKTGVENIEQAKQRVDKALADKRKNPTEDELKLQAEITSLRAQEEGTASKVSTAQARVFELEARIKSLREGFSLARFLTDRTRSEDYRKHLGLISTIRQDFESLYVRLGRDHTGALDAFQPVERIILYIDDLDRLPAEKVMDVLQAVHLLLAYPLFVVVVGVDPRWLLHSLGTTYSAFQNDARRFRASAKMWRTTPQNYLEKIFQIPFSLRPMSMTGFGKLMSGLLTSGSKKETKASSEKTAGAELDSTYTAQIPSHTQAADLGASAHAQSSALPAAEAGQFVINEESLTIQTWEGQFAEKLFGLISTPRAAKRFSNIYRILKAPVHQQQLSQFEGTPESPGEFQLPMLLLAFLIALPAEAALMFPKLYQHARDGEDFAASMRALKKEIGSLTSHPSLEKLDAIIAAKGFPRSAPLVTEWIPRVSRFSFEVGRAIQNMNSMTVPSAE